MSRESKLALAGEPEPLAEVSNLIIGDPTHPVPARLYRAVPLDLQGQAVPLLIFFHGGGWMMGDLDTHDQLCRRLAAGTGGTILAVDYRLSPEHRFPCAVEDALSAVSWASRNCEMLGVDAARISVGGDSAGGNLAAVVAQASRASADIRVHSQVLLYPVLDLSLKHAAGYELDDDFPLTFTTLAWFRSHYLRSAEDELDWRASPLLADHINGLPPALVVTMRYDPLCIEGHEYVRRLQENNIVVLHFHISDQCHGFLNSGKCDERYTEAMRIIAAATRYLWAMH